MEELKKSFNQVAEVYDKMRPGYAAALYEDLFRLKLLDRESRVLEIGIGTGQASKPILDTGCWLTAVEPGDKLAALAAEKFAAYPQFSIENKTFEDFEAPEGSFDLIYAATAFHWIPEEIGYPKVLRLLKKGGIFARFANHPAISEEQEELSDAIQEHYRTYMNSKNKPSRFQALQAEKLAALGEKYGFVESGFCLYQRERVFSGEEYVALLGTYSDHNALEESKRREFFDKIRREIERSGDRLVIHDVMDLEWYRKG